MFHLSHSLFILALFLKFVLSIAGTQLGVSVGRSMRVKNPYIKESALKPSTPEAVCSNVKPSTILSVRGSSECPTTGRLKRWLDTNVIADFC